MPAVRYANYPPEEIDAQQARKEAEAAAWHARFQQQEAENLARLRQRAKKEFEKERRRDEEKEKQTARALQVTLIVALALLAPVALVVLACGGIALLGRLGH